MTCSECLARIMEVRELERIHSEKREMVRADRTAVSRRDHDTLWAPVQSAEFDVVLARLKLKRHQQRPHRDEMVPGLNEADGRRTAAD